LTYISAVINWKHGWIIKSGQKYFTPNHEKGARNQNCKTQVGKTFEVGQPNYARNGTAAPPGEEGVYSSEPLAPRTSWFNAKSEIPPNKSWFG
jgi:hypothetical protein